MKEAFRPSATAYARVESGRVLKFFIPLAAIIVLASLAGALFDVRWLLVGMMLVMVFAPAAFFFLWFGMTGRQDARFRLRPQRWTVSPDAIHIDFFRFDDDEFSEPEKTIEIELKDIRSFDRRGEWWCLRTARTDNGVLLVPIEHLDAENVKILSHAAFVSEEAEDDVTLA